MNGKDNRFNNDLDSLIDRALANYMPYEPLPGLAERILTAVPGAKSRPTRAVRASWAIAATIFLVSIAMISLWFKSERLEIAIIRRPALTAMERPMQTSTAPPEPAGSTPQVFRAAVRRPAPKPSTNREFKHDRTTGTLHHTGESTAFVPIVIRPIVIAPIRMRTMD